MSQLSYTEIRALRGERTRAAFAAELGVDPHTVYRWELPPGSPQARRPRGQALARLRALVGGGPGADRAVPGVAGSELAASSALPSSPADDHALPVTAALQRVLDGDWRDAEGVFLRAVSDSGASPAIHALASCGLACIELLFRSDGRRALAALGTALTASTPIPLAEALAALAYSLPDGELFDVGRVHAHAGRAEALARGDSPVSIAIAVAAEAQSALLSGHDDLLLRALARLEDMPPVAMPEVAAMFVEHLRILAASRTGHIRLANERLERLLANPRLAECPPLEARAYAARALRSLEELGDPDDALVLARRARQVAEAARLPLGIHTALILRVEVEALFRLGRMAEAGQVVGEVNRVFTEARFPATVALPAQLRYLLLCGGADDLQSQADRLAAVELPSLRPAAQAFAAWFAATAAFVRGADPEATLAAFARAEQLCEHWGPLRRDVLGAYANAALAEGRLGEARAILARAQRAADRAPSAWSSAHLRRIEGVLLIAEGRLDEGRVIFEAAAATFEASGDRVDAVLARYGTARMAAGLGDASAEARVAAIEAELAGMGVPRPEFIVRAVDRATRSFADVRRSPAASTLGTVTPTLEIALQRLAVTGATAAMIRRELVAVTRELVAAPVALAEQGEAADHDATTAWFAVGGPTGPRLGVAGALGDREHATLRVVALVAGLALEAAALREGDGPAASAEVPEVPGLVAASPAMRHLLADVRRLAGSRATVVITGESGAGKELIAHALHHLSPRAARPYIAFNCAAVPRELFEGQLFGYRKGAFTGASADHAGVIRAADGGTLFLDEIGELPLDIQPKLLRFLDNAEVFPLGAQRAVTVDVRVVAATNRDLAAEVRSGRFREDLYYRLLVVPLVVPPLRTRREDVVPLARFFAGLATEGERPPAFAPDALAALAAHTWPGNVRELRNVIARALAYSPRPDVITRARLGL
jgi:hypothetical protein